MDYQDLYYYVYDNSLAEDVEAKNMISSNFFYFHDVTNPGVSYAYNSAVEYAASHNIDWVLLLDQDTFLPCCLLSEYFNAIQINGAISMFVPKIFVEGRGYMSPCLFKHKRGRFMFTVPTGIVQSKQYTVINSGIMLSASSFIECGGYNNSVYLDYSDHDFFSRFKLYNPFFYVIDVACYQNFACLSTDTEALEKRYSILCECVKNISKPSLVDKYEYFYMLFRRAIHLVVITRKFSFLKIMYKVYIKSSIYE